MIEVKHVTKKINKKTVLDDVDVSFEEGKIYLISGHNGCGKTMLLRLLCGLITPDEGTVETSDIYKYGVIIENPKFMENYSAFYNLKYLASINSQMSAQEIEEALDEVGLLEVKDDKVKSFSLGMKQRLGIIQAVMENQEVILLDEPFNALDDASYKMVEDILRKRKSEGKTIIVASHGIAEEKLLLFDEIIKMEKGRII
jgi:ABC-2 type transport system ATP-binding protein